MSQNVSFLEKGTGLSLVLLHGIGVDSAGWQYQIDDLSDSYRVIALDLPGYGGSTALNSLTFPNLATWLHDFLLENSIQAPVLVGNSFGGMIVQEYLARYPSQTRAAVLTGTSPAFGRKDGEWQQKFVRARLAPLDESKTMADLAPTIVASLVGSAAKDEGITLARKSMANVSNETFRAVLHCLIDFDQRENLGKIDIPCLLIVGEEDTNAPPAVMEKMVSKIPGGQFVKLPKLGHLAHLEDAALFNVNLRSFLNNI